MDPVDQLVGRFDRALRTLVGVTGAGRESPARSQPQPALSESEAKHVAGLMRVNHTGEICAQALYEGQSLTAKGEQTKAQLRSAAVEELDHLGWCRERLKELESRPSILDPLWYVTSYGLGALVGLLGDRLSLGFVEATEDRVVAHLRDHEARLPERDARTRAVLEQMREDEQRHGAKAAASGATLFDESVKRAMATVAKVMTSLSYRF